MADELKTGEQLISDLMGEPAPAQPAAGASVEDPLAPAQPTDVDGETGEPKDPKLIAALDGAGLGEPEPAAPADAAAAQDGAGAAPEAAGDAGAVAGEDTPAAAAYRAWAAADPEGAAIFEASLETQRVAAQAATDAAAANPTADGIPAPNAAQAAADYQAWLINEQRTLAKADSDFSARADAYLAAKADYDAEKAVNPQSALVQRERQRLVNEFNALTQLKNDLASGRQYVEEAAFIREEVAAYDALKPHLATYAMLRLQGKLRGTEPIAHRVALVNQALAANGQQIIGADPTAPKKPLSPAAAARYKKMGQAPNLARSMPKQPSAQAGKPRTEAHGLDNIFAKAGL